jgi:hypothetical protein
MRDDPYDEPVQIKRRLLRALLAASSSTAL